MFKTSMILTSGTNKMLDNEQMLNETMTTAQLEGRTPMKCRNCNVEMRKKLTPITFTPTPKPRTWWRCPKCGSEIQRTPDVGELDGDTKYYSLPVERLRREDETWITDRFRE